MMGVENKIGDEASLPFPPEIKNYCTLSVITRLKFPIFQFPILHIYIHIFIHTYVHKHTHTYIHTVIVCTIYSFNLNCRPVKLLVFH